MKKVFLALLIVFVLAGLTIVIAPAVAPFGASGTSPPGTGGLELPLS